LPYKRENKKTKTSNTGNHWQIQGHSKQSIAFEKYRKKKVFIKEVDLKFRKEFIKYLSDVEKLSSNTIGRYITFIKTVCRDAKIYNIETNPQLEAFKGFTDDTAKIHFTFDELEKIERVKFLTDGLLNARDWLLIGCYIGQRVSDLLVLTKENIVHKGGLELIQLKQKKTGKEVVIPIHPKG
jgi:integrase